MLRAPPSVGGLSGAEFGDLMNEFTRGLVNGVTLVEIKQDSVLFSSLFPAEGPLLSLLSPTAMTYSFSAADRPLSLKATPPT